MKPHRLPGRCPAGRRGILGRWCFCLWLLSGGAAALAQTPEPTLLPAQLPRLTPLDLPILSGGLSDDDWKMPDWAGPVLDYPLGLSRQYVRAYRVRVLTFQGIGGYASTDVVGAEPGDVFQGHDSRVMREKSVLPPFRRELDWRFRYEYNPFGQLLQAEGTLGDYTRHGSAASGWRLLKRYDARQRPVELRYDYYNNEPYCPGEGWDTKNGWRRWLGYDTAGRLSTVAERIQASKALYGNFDPCQQVNSWFFDRLHYDAAGRLRAVYHYASADSATADSLRLLRKTLYRYDARGQLASTFSVGRPPYAGKTGGGWRYVHQGGQLRRQSWQEYPHWSFADTLNLDHPAAGAAPLPETDVQTYDHRGRLLHLVDQPDTVRREYHRRWLLETVEGPEHGPRTRLVLLGPGGCLRRIVEVQRHDAYLTFNRNPSCYGNEKDPPDAEKYRWLPADSPLGRLAKQWRLTVVDRRYHYDAAGRLQGFTADLSFNRHALRRPTSDSLDAYLAERLLTPRWLAHGRGLRRVLRHHPGWPYRRAERQRFEDFRYEYY